ncbi:Polyketide biosynthesis acyl-carrier-protein AcpK [Corallococcus coralloides]|uniref:Polyketide biosynthesis acyl-carrier-protein AcpK n=2 Tax=Corallococcus coralloides TaxID=184914 RepID=A0A410RS63_CORCK|nr:phosphopantetheine-binding protein [Corallococcus coralloides]QAT84733.1 Polyketide biosynthesis acyl-carrier-protein AcpK [Corallococcus coralloides]
MTAMGPDAIFSIVRGHAATVLSISPDSVPFDGRLVDLGANSIDRLEIVTMTMESLGLKFSLVELSHVDNIRDLVGFFHAKAQRGAA